MSVAVGFANFFDLYEIFLGGVLAAVLAEHVGPEHERQGAGDRVGLRAGCSSARSRSARSPTASAAGGCSCQPVIYSGFSLAAAFSPEPDLARHPALPRRLRARRRAVAGGHLPQRAAAAPDPRPLHGRAPTRSVSSACRWPRSSARSSSRGEHLLIDGWRWLLVVGSLGAVVVCDDAAQPARVAALARDPRPPRRGRPRDPPDRGQRPRGAAASTELPEPEPVEVAPASGAPSRRSSEPPYRRRTVMLCDLPVPADGRLLRLRHAGAARPGRQGLRHRRDASASRP